MRAFQYETLVTFNDTNVVGNVYFAQYLMWQGKCREAFLFERAPQIIDDFKVGYGMITKEVKCSFQREAFAFDRLLIEMFLDDLTRIGIGMRFDYYRLEPQGRVLLAEGSQTTMWINPEHRISVMPDYLYNAVRDYAEGVKEKAAS